MTTTEASQHVLTQYQNWAPQTAVYPLTGDKIGFTYRQNPFYCAMGLVGEALEFEQSVISETPDKAAKELSDVLWYAAMLASECGWLLEDLIYHGQDVLAGHSGPSDLIGFNIADGLHVVATGVLEPLKKLWRDGHTEKQWMALRDALAATVACIDEQALILGEDGINAIAEISRSKLSQRKAEGKLHGSGSDR